MNGRIIVVWNRKPILPKDYFCGLLACSTVYQGHMFLSRRLADDSRNRIDIAFVDGCQIQRTHVGFCSVVRWEESLNGF